MKNLYNIRYRLCLLLTIAGLALSACTGLPDGIEPVEEFEIDRYLGTWYEIARLDHRFERGLSGVTATYRLRDDGTIEVINRGYDDDKGEWREATGKARFAGDSSKGHLEVSFFGPFYASYVVFWLDPDYEIAMVTGHNRSYFWLLSRSSQLSPRRLQELLAIARDRGFTVEELIFVTQEDQEAAASEH